MNNKFKNNKLVMGLFLIVFVVIITKTTCDMMGYRMMDLVSSPRDKEASDSSYGASHK